LFLGFLSPGDAGILDSQDNLTILKSGGDRISIERTRKSKFRHALRSVSKVAFSQLGLGKSSLLFISSKTFTDILQKILSILYLFDINQNIR